MLPNPVVFTINKDGTIDGPRGHDDSATRESEMSEI